MNTVVVAICLIIGFNAVHSLLSCILEYALHPDERESLFKQKMKTISFEKFIPDMLALGILLLLFTFGPDSITIHIYGLPTISIHDLHELRIVIVLSLVPLFLSHLFPKMRLQFDNDRALASSLLNDRHGNDRHAPKAPTIEMEIRALKMTKADRNLRLSWLKQMSSQGLHD